MCIQKIKNFFKKEKQEEIPYRKLVSVPFSEGIATIKQKFENSTLVEFDTPNHKFSFWFDKDDVFLEVVHSKDIGLSKKVVFINKFAFKNKFHRYLEDATG